MRILGSCISVIQIWYAAHRLQMSYTVPFFTGAINLGIFVVKCTIKHGHPVITDKLPNMLASTLLILCLDQWFSLNLL
jgi:hypothetical protein